MQQLEPRKAAKSEPTLRCKKRCQTRALGLTVAPTPSKSSQNKGGEAQIEKNAFELFCDEFAGIKLYFVFSFTAVAILFITLFCCANKYEHNTVNTYMNQLLLLGKFEYTGGPIFKVVLEC